LTLVANPHYYLGAPKLKEIIIKFIPDENTELSALRTHDLDWQFEASPDQYAQLKALPGVRLVLQDRNEFERVQINTSHPPLDDVRVRQAIAYALDVSALVADLTFGSATAADQDLPPFMWAHAARVMRYPHDVQRAKALLAQAGWTPGPDGVVRKGGRRLSLTLVTQVSNVTRRLAVVQTQAMLRQVGIAVEPKFYPGALLFAAMGDGGILQNGRFDLAWNAWVSGIDPDQSSLVLCDAQPPHGNNETHYCNADVDTAEHTALNNFQQPARKKAYARIEALLTRDEPRIPIWWPHQIQPINPDFHNFAPNPVTESWNAYEWDI